MTRLSRRVASAVATTTALLGILPTAQADAAPRHPVLRAQAYEVEAQQYLADLNAMRSERGLQAVQLLTDDARHGVTQRWLDRQGDLPVHSTTFGAEFAAVGCQAAGENFVWTGGDGPEEPVFDGHDAARSWRNSPSHYETLMNPDIRFVTFAIRRGSGWNQALGTNLTWLLAGSNTLLNCDPATTSSPEVTPKKLVVKRGVRVVRR